jgi:hypothetical protein
MTRLCHPNQDGEENGKAWEQGDELVEMRFYVPGMKEKENDGSDVENGDDEMIAR